ncbi:MULTISPECIES: hypothetical protein [unclassified Microbacterium]|uniref:hypothetical protein n=1 Tax=unclassified Microbacterium TaxID=2609290 RepID=UPI000AE5FC5C|nr:MULTISPECIES: hypothetical protein [unclassified Microbacterium]
MTDEKNAPQPEDVTEPPVEGAPTEREVPAESVDPDVSYDSLADAFTAITDGPDAVDETAPPQYGVGPFSVREVALGGIWLVAFVVSFFPVYSGILSGSVWTSGIDWVLTIGVPTIAVFLVGLRRLSPQGIRRVGSLGIDQFASVAFSVATIVWLGILWASFVNLATRQIFLASWVVWVEFILMFAGVLLTVFAPLFPTIGEDFRHRTTVPAHRFASPARPVVERPHTPRPAPSPAPEAVPQAAASSSSSSSEQAFGAAVDGPLATETSEVEPIVDEVVTTTAAAPASQAFWALAPVERTVVDETGAPIFTIGPSAWALVIEDRGESFVVRHDDGRIGYLTDVSGVTRG